MFSKGITLSDMIGTLKEFFSSIFKKEVDVRVTPDYFPFVEPGNGMELSCFLCDMKGCRVCKGTGWLEILGCGMIHPYVLKEGDADPNVYSGFAWGFGVDRLAMLKYEIEDVRLFHSGDLRFIRQF
jgi:phenylalanyl-tRNA synthetase alpha chain